MSSDGNTENNFKINAHEMRFIESQISAALEKIRGAQLKAFFH